jgi:hypothetical protein
MTLFRRSFYMLLGFSFLFYWGFHMEGFADLLYRPIQVIASTESTMWPSFITAFLTYAGLIVLIERLWRGRADFTNEWDDRGQTPFFDHEALLQGQRDEKTGLQIYNNDPGTIPEWHIPRQPPLPDHESFLPGRCREKEQDPPHLRESSTVPGASSPGTER